MIPSPPELGFPEKFDKWRPEQVDAIERILRNKKRFFGLAAPTGFGKTAVAIAVSILSKQPTCINTSSRALQDQYNREFAPLGLVDIRGRRNYACDMRHDYTCEDGYHARCPYKGTVACAASQAEMRAATSRLVVTNYEKWIASRRFGVGMSHFTQVIFDEAHVAPGALDKAMQITLSTRDIEEILKLDFPPVSQRDDVINWRPWASAAKAIAEEDLRNIKLKLQTASDVKPSWLRSYGHLRNLVRKLSTLSTANPEHWIVDAYDKGYQFDPIRSGRYAESTLFLKTPSVILVSATLCPKTFYMLGVSKGDFEFVEYDSSFDSERCPIYYVPTMRVDSRAPSLAMLWARLDQVASKRRDRKGIVHTVSYARRDEILQSSRFAESMMINMRGEPPTEIIDAFKMAGPGAILVSPSVGEGHDFPLKDCEWQIICKIPFPDSRSKIMKARQSDDSEYGGYLAMQDLVQSSGRGMRLAIDQCETFLFDDHIQWFANRFGHLAPKSFHRRLRRKDVLPSPPPALP